MLFRRDIEPDCEYCRYGTKLGFGEIGCVKLGITASGESCPKFRYDPGKREPERRAQMDTSGFTKEDFEL